jgi:hypothetical protein
MDATIRLPISSRTRKASSDLVDEHLCPDDAGGARLGEFDRDGQAITVAFAASRSPHSRRSASGRLLPGRSDAR